MSYTGVYTHIYIMLVLYEYLYDEYVLQPKDDVSERERDREGVLGVVCSSTEKNDTQQYQYCCTCGGINATVSTFL